MIFKKTITGLLSLSILLSITVMPSAMAQNQTVIPAAQNQNLTDQRLKDVTNFLNEYNISRCISRRQGPNEAIIAFYAICSILQVYDQNDLGRAKAWEKAESIKLIPPGLEKADELTALEFLDLLFHAAGITISPVTLSHYKESLRGVNLQLRDKELEIVATALEQGLFSEPQDRTESRLLKNKLTRGSISNADAMTFLYQTAVSAHQQPVITITNISEPSETFELEQILKSVIDTIRTDSYYKADFNEKAAVENAIKALVGSLEQDHYIEFYTEEEFQMFSSGLNGTVEGIGAYIEEKEGVIYVVSPIEGSPASKAGLHPGDIITHVDNVSTDGMSIQEAVNRIRGTNGTSVKLSIRRGTQSLEFNIVRSRVDIPELIHKKQDGIDILKLTQFGNNSSNEMRNVLEEISAGNPKGLIIDLRNNPGGFLMEVINILDLFLEPGEPIVYVKNRTDQEIFKGNVKPIITGVPIVILINKGSASASEILAGALQGHSLAKIIGEISFGKGTVQNIISFQGGSAFKYTTAEYLVPGKQKNSVSINNIGVYPDSNPAGTDPKNFVDNPDTPEDEVLDAALKMLK